MSFHMERNGKEVTAEQIQNAQDRLHAAELLYAIYGDEKIPNAQRRKRKLSEEIRALKDELGIAHDD